jgi:hypothetical protein
MHVRTRIQAAMTSQFPACCPSSHWAACLLLSDCPSVQVSCPPGHLSSKPLRELSMDKALKPPLQAAIWHPFGQATKR